MSGVIAPFATSPSEWRHTVEDRRGKATGKKSAQDINRKTENGLHSAGKPFSTGARLVVARCLPVRAIVMVRLMMVPHRGVPVVAVHVSERHRRGSERGYDENSKNLFENKFHGNPSGSIRLVSVEKRDAKHEATAMRRHFNP